MKIRLLILATTLSIIASNANALIVSCNKKYVPFTGQSTLVATFRWTRYEARDYPIGYQYTAAVDPDGWNPDIRTWIFLPDTPGRVFEHILVWATPGHHEMVSTATSFGVRLNPARMVENPAPDECGPMTRWLG